MVTPIEEVAMTTIMAAVARRQLECMVGVGYCEVVLSGVEKAMKILGGKVLMEVLYLPTQTKRWLSTANGHGSESRDEIEVEKSEMAGRAKEPGGSHYFFANSMFTA